MAKPTTREGLKLWALRRLGAPVIEINADDDQLDDRIDEALEKFQEYHHEGVVKMYLKHKVTPSTLTIDDADDIVGFENNNIVTGETSGATARIIKASDGQATEGTTIVVRDANIEGTFLDGETITSNGGGEATLIDTDAVTLGTIDLRYIDVPDLVFGITRLLHFGGTTSAGNIFDFQYQLRLHDLYNLTSTSMIYYTQIMQHIDLIDFTLNAKPMLNFNRMQNRVYPLINWYSDIVAGDHVVLDGYMGLDPEEFTKTYHHPWLLKYTTELFRLQWGENLSKYRNLELPGRVTLNADAIIARAEAGIEKLERELITEAGPLEMFLG